MKRRMARTPPAVGLFGPADFSGFGPCRLAGESPSFHVAVGAHASTLRAAVRRDCPRRPGVYGMVDENGELIYVGKAKCLRTRLFSYFRPRGRDPKAGRILKLTRAVVWEFVTSEFAALLRELELIQRWKPRLNISGHPGRHHRAFICLGRRPAPYLFMSARPGATAAAVFGPVSAGKRAREAVRRCNDWFRLRDCPQPQPMIFAEENKLFPIVRTPGCIRHEIGTCLAPCAAACTRTGYAREVEAARAFLEGRSSAPLEALKRDMETASAQLAFERAAALRDQLDSLGWLARTLERLRAAEGKPCVVYAIAGHGDEARWYVICHGRVTADVPAPRDAAQGEAVAATIDALQAQRRRPPSPRELSAVLLVSAWFRRYPKERECLLEPAEALRRCRTAGKSTRTG